MVRDFLQFAPDPSQARHVINPCRVKVLHLSYNTGANVLLHTIHIVRVIIKGLHCTVAIRWLSVSIFTGIMKVLCLYSHQTVFCTDVMSVTCVLVSNNIPNEALQMPGLVAVCLKWGCHGYSAMKQGLNVASPFTLPAIFVAMAKMAKYRIKFCSVIGRKWSIPFSFCIWLNGNITRPRLFWNSKASWFLFMIRELFLEILKLTSLDSTWMT